MDGFLASVLVGVIVAVVSAAAAYYFGVRQERQKRVYEKQREEEERREEREREEQQRREERQKEQNKRYAEALDGIRDRGSATVTVYRAWVERVANDVAGIDRTKSYEEWREQFGEFARQGDEDVGGEVASLKNYYLQQKPYLEPKTRQIFESFLEQLEERRSMLTYTLKESSERYSDLRSKSQWKETVSSKLWGYLAPDLDFGPVNYGERDSWGFNAYLYRLKQAIEWDYQSHLDALSAEAERLAGKHSQA
jgi:hypothetical protein